MQLGEARRHNGGWKGSPNSIAALLRCQVPRDLLPKCKRCRRLAVSGHDLCIGHIGRWRAQPDGAGRAESRTLAKLERAGLLPLELIALPVWRNLAGLATSQRAPARLALVQVWDRRYAEPMHWAKVQRRAIDLGKQPGKRHNTAPWYENR